MRLHILLLLLCLPVLPLRALAADVQSPRRFVFTCEVLLRNLPGAAQKVELWLPVPPDTPEQEVLSLRVDSPVEGEFTQERVYGNRMWYARTAPPPDGTWRVTMRVEAVRREQQTDWKGKGAELSAPGNLGLFLQSNRLIPLTPRFKQIASRETQGRAGVIAQARALYDYVMERMVYDKSSAGWGRGDANYACDIGKGNCTDYHSLFIALGRSVNTPVRFWMGFSLPPVRGEGRVAGYHCWAEFWAPEAGWVPVDISEADKRPEKADYFFGNADENRLAFSLGRDLRLVPGQQGPPINFFIYPYAEADGTPWNQVDHHFTYQDLP